MTVSGGTAMQPGPIETEAEALSPPVASANIPSELVSRPREESLQEELAVAGYAKVIATLKPEPTHVAAVAALAPDAQATESSLAAHFVVPNELQAASLALVSRRSARRQPAHAASASPRRVRVFPKLGLAIGYVDAAGLASLSADGRVQKVAKAPELSLIRPVVSRAAKLGTKTTWGLKRLKVDRLWAAGYKGKGVVVGHLDTGVDGTHPAMKGAIAAFAEFDMSADEVPDAAPRDSGTHGTHTAGTIVGRSGTKGAFGVAPEARLASAMVIEGGQVIDRILAGMEWLVGQGVRIVSMSAGLRGYTSSFETIIDALRAANILPVVASGNEGVHTSRSPGNYSTVLSVGALDSSDAIPDFSSSRNFERAADPIVPDLVAPGVGVLSCIPNRRYAEDDGTSMATPHIAGLAALLLQAKPSATAAELERAILGSCSLPAGVEVGRANRGVPDAVKAFNLLTGKTLPTSATPAATTVRRRSVSARRSKPKKGNKSSRTVPKRPQKHRARRAGR